MTDPAAKQYYRCANTPNSEISKLIDFQCPLHKKNKFTGNFRKAGYKIDISGVALCPDCFARKTQKYCEEIDSINTKYGITLYGSLVKGKNYDSPKEQYRSYYLDNSESNEVCLDHISPYQSIINKPIKIDDMINKSRQPTLNYKSILTSDMSESSNEDLTISDIEVSEKIPSRTPKPTFNPKKAVKRPITYRK